MKTIKTTVLGLIGFCLLTGVGEQQSTRDRRKQKINFWGTLSKYTGTKKEYHVENMSIARITEQVDVFEKPDLPIGPLANDPRKGTIIHLDFKEAALIKVPNPEAIWTFKRNDRAEKKEYLEIEVYPRGGGKPNNYIIDLNRRLYCDEKSTGGPIEMDVPFNEIKQLTIEGYTARTEPIQNNGQQPPVGCYVCPATPMPAPTPEVPAATPQPVQQQ